MGHRGHQELMVQAELLAHQVQAEYLALLEPQELVSLAPMELLAVVVLPVQMVHQVVAALAEYLVLRGPVGLMGYRAVLVHLVQVEQMDWREAMERLEQMVHTVLVEVAERQVRTEVMVLAEVVVLLVQMEAQVRLEQAVVLVHTGHLELTEPMEQAEAAGRQAPLAQVELLAVRAVLVLVVQVVVLVYLK